MTAQRVSKPRPRTLRRSPQSNRPIIALLTDFGTDDHYVGTMKGVIASIAPETPVVDVTHGVPSQDIRSGSFMLWASYRFFPEQTIFVPVVDPGVGTGRGVRIAWSGKYTFVAPDNGILDLVVSEEESLEAVDLDAKGAALTLGAVSSTFHGRDIFAPLAAYLSRGVSPGSLGRKVLVQRKADQFVSSSSVRAAIILHQDHFGNCITNIRSEMMSRIVSIAVRGTTISHMTGSYQQAPENTVSLIGGSSGLVELCIRNGSAATRLGTRNGESLKISWR